MAASNAALIVHDDGSFEATPELREALHLAAGTRLELVQQSSDEVRFRIPRWPAEIKSWRDLEGILADSDVAKRGYEPGIKGDWRRLRGIFKDHEINLNDELRKDRLAELASDERMLSGRSR